MIALMRCPYELNSMHAGRKKGRRFDANESRVPDPSKWLDSTNEKLGSFWRPDLMKQMTYSQLWQLVQEGRIEKVGQPLC